MSYDRDDDHRRPRRLRDRESRRHGDPYGDTFSRSLRDDRTAPPRARRTRDDDSGRLREDRIAGRRGYGSSWSDGAGLGEGVRYSGRRSGYGDPSYSGGYGSDRDRATYGLSGAEGGLDADDWVFGDRREGPRIGAGAFGGQKGGLSGGYGRLVSGQHREQAAVPGAFGGRRNMRGRGPRGYTRTDERIREDLCDMLTDDPYLDASDIEVKVAQGTVTLSGMVTEPAARDHAEDLAEQVSGVRQVRNDLRVSGPDGLRRFGELS